MNNNPNLSTKSRIRIVYGVVLVICAIFVLRLFYLQVLRHSYYQAQAQNSQLRLYQIPAERGIIYAQDGGEPVPIVLNEIRYRIVADPQIIEDKEQVAQKVASVLSVDSSDINNILSSSDKRYEILASKQTKDIKEEIERLATEGEIIGIFTEKTSQRVYPQNNLAAQTLGYVDDDGKGNYGIEGFLNDELSGAPGRVKALTDQNGIPLLATGENISEDPVDGRDVTLTIDVAMQKQLEQILKTGLENAKSDSGGIIIMDPNSGAIKAMAAYPTYDPSKISEIEDVGLFLNSNTSSPLEPGSIMKTLTSAAALDQGVVGVNTTYFDPGFYNVDDATIRNVAEVAGAGTRSISDILRLSLNTGATYLLMQMGGGEINEQARLNWHDYMTNHYQLGKTTGIEQDFEAEGSIPDPIDGWGLNIKYANTAFGQGMTATPLQMIAAVASVVNGGTYFQPTLVAGMLDENGDYSQKDPVVVESNVVSDEVSATERDFMTNVVNNNLPSASREGYNVGGKTGTAEIANPEGGYYEDRYNGTYVGFVGGDLPQYVVLVRVNEPKIPGYAGSRAAGPIFSDTINMLIDNFSVKTIGS